MDNAPNKKYPPTNNPFSNQLIATSPCTSSYNKANANNRTIVPRVINSYIILEPQNGALIYTILSTGSMVHKRHKIVVAPIHIKTKLKPQ